MVSFAPFQVKRGGGFTTILNVLSRVVPVTLSVTLNVTFVVPLVFVGGVPLKVAGEADAEPKLRPATLPLVILNVTSDPPRSSVATRFWEEEVPTT
jgi:hypothetical protein